MEKSITRLRKAANLCLPSGSASPKTSVGKWSFSSGRWPVRPRRLPQKSPTFRSKTESPIPRWKTRKSNLWFRPGSGSRPLSSTLSISDFRQRARHFLHVRHDRNVIVFGPRYVPLLINDKNRASRDAPVGHIHPVLLAHRASRVKISQQGILDPHFLRVCFVRPHAIHAYPSTSASSVSNCFISFTRHACSFVQVGLQSSG